MEFLSFSLLSLSLMWKAPSGSFALLVTTAVILAGALCVTAADCKAHKPVVVIPGIMGTVLEGFVLTTSSFVIITTNSGNNK